MTISELLSDSTSVASLAERFIAAWNRHDLNAFGGLFTTDAEFVNVVGLWWRGRQQIQAAHAHSHATFFRDSVLDGEIASLKFLSDDVGLVHIRWTLSGHLDPDGTKGTTRKGILVLTAIRSDDWMIAAAQNVNEVPEAHTRMAPVSHDRPRIVVFPPVVPIATLIAAAVLQWFFPLNLFYHIPPLANALIGASLVVLGVGLLAGGAVALVRAGTHIRPSQPALSLVESGVYRWTRNPFYVGGSLAMIGCGFLFGLDWLPLLVVPSLAILHFGIILPEEAYLENRFGDAYKNYKSKVLRYIGGI